MAEHDSFAIYKFWPILFDWFIQFHKLLAINISVDCSVAWKWFKIYNTFVIPPNWQHDLGKIQLSIWFVLFVHHISMLRCDFSSFIIRFKKRCRLHYVWTQTSIFLTSQISCVIFHCVRCYMLSFGHHQLWKVDQNGRKWARQCLFLH